MNDPGLATQSDIAFYCAAAVCALCACGVPAVFIGVMSTVTLAIFPVNL